MPMTESQWIDELSQKKKYWQPLFDRMDADRDLLTDKFVLMDKAGKKAMRDVVSVTLPKINIFVSKVITMLMDVEKQVAVVSDSMTANKTSKIEEFIKCVGLAADGILTSRGRAERHVQHSEFVCKRGVIGEQYLLRPDPENPERLLPIIRPLDFRYTIPEITDDGVAYCAVETTRTKRDVMNEYRKYDPNLLITVDKVKVKDVWDDEENLIFFDDKLWGTFPNPYGRAPFEFAFAPAGSFLWEDDEVEHMAESVFETIRDIVPEMNRLASILTTQQYSLIRPATAERSAEGKQAAPPKVHPMTEGTHTMIDLQGGIEVLKQPDVMNSTRIMLGSWDADFQRQTLSNTDYGSSTEPLSAVAMNKLSASRESFLAPRRKAMASLEVNGDKHIIHQFEVLASSLKVGIIGHQQTFSPSDLTGEYDITCNFKSRSTELDSANAAIAAGLGKTVPMRYKREVIMQLDNPDRIQEEIDEEDAAELDPVIKLFRQGLALIRKAHRLGTDEGAPYDAEARLILSRIKFILTQRKASANVPHNVPLDSGITAGASPNDGMKQPQH